MNVNNLAIVLTKHIEVELVSTFGTKGELPPTFYNIRETILNTLNDYLVEVTVKSEHSPRMLKEMSLKERENFMNYQLEREGALIMKTALESKDLVDKFVFKDEWSTLESTRKTMVVLKAGKLREEARNVMPAALRCEGAPQRSGEGEA